MITRSIFYNKEYCLEVYSLDVKEWLLQEKLMIFLGALLEIVNHSQNAQEK